MNTVIQVDGGIGRVICSTPAIDRIAQDRCVTIITGYPEVFWNNPNIHKVYNVNREYLWEDVVKDSDFRCPEPYHDRNYYTQQCHLIQSFDALLGGEGAFSFPKLYLDAEERAWAKTLIQEIRIKHPKPIALLQCFGAGAAIFDGELQDKTYRSLPLPVVDMLCKKSECIYINASHIPMDYPNVWQQKFTLRQIFALAWACDFVVSIDSCVGHAGAAFGKSGILFVGATYSQNVGYPNYRMVCRDGYPKCYSPNRIGGGLDANRYAMSFDEKEISEVADMINNQFSKCSGCC